MDKKPEKLVPEVRFKGFTDDWEQRKGKSIFYSKSNKDFPELIVLSATQDKGMIPRSSTGIDIKYEKKNLRGYKKVESGDFIVHLRSFQGGFAYSNLTGIVSPAYTVFTFKQPEMFNNYFWKEKFTSYNFIQLLKKVTYGVRDGRSISYSDFLTLNEKFPVKVEQTKIADLFKIIDNLITLQQRKLKQLKRLKTAMLQQLFVEKNSKLPILRFKNFNGDWKQCKLGELVESLFQGINTAADKVEYSNNGLPIIQAKNITSGSLDFSGSRKLSVQKYSNYLDKYIPQKGDILFANIGTIGPNVILKDTRQFFIAWNILRIVPQKNINGEFLKITLDLLNSKHYFEKLLTGNATKFVNKNDMRNLPIFFSDPEEQNKISNLFKKLDFLITLQQNKLTQLSTLKKYLLQKMFI
ncbi:hypothetical protein IMSAG044_00156 [Lactobacillaceae bacterium]|nr:hypothetical protein IMSAG044_00156 [Lactobacillaceae bacterium]